jgi:hypothetical protein
MALVIPWLLRPIVYGALATGPWRTAAMTAVAVTFVVTGICVRVSWPFSWGPTCSLACVFAAVISPWHTLTVCIACIGLIVLLAILLCPAPLPLGRRRSSSAPLWGLALLAPASFLIGLAVLRMSVVAGFPFSLAQAVNDPKNTLLYLRDNPHALDERTPDALPWVLYAAKHGDLTVLEAILARGAPLRGYNWNAMGSPMAWLAANADYSDPCLVEKARLLAHYGAPPAGVVIAAQRGHAPLVRALIDLGDEVDQPDSEGRTVLGTLIEKNSVAAVQCLLASGVQLAAPYGSLARARLVSVHSAAMWEVLKRYGQDTPSRLQNAPL